MCVAICMLVDGGDGRGSQGRERLVLLDVSSCHLIDDSVLNVLHCLYLSLGVFGGKTLLCI